MFKRSIFLVLAFALPLALACSSDSNEGGGGLDAALGAQMSELGDLGDRFVGENAATYDTLGDASSIIGDALEGGLTLASTAPKQAGCLPDSLSGTTLLVDVSTNDFMPSDPRGPSDAVQFRLLSESQAEVGYINVTCAGVLPSISVNIRVYTSDDAEVLNLTASQISVFPPSTFNAILGGTLFSASGDEVPFGMYGFEIGSSLGLSEGSLFAETSFLVGETTIAAVSRNVFEDASFGSENIRLIVEEQSDFSFDFICPSLFNYEANMSGMPGNVSGGGVFCARPPLADDFNYHVNCDDGSVDDMVVTAATLACQGNTGFVGDATQLSSGALQDIQEGTNALLGMHNAVIGVAQAGAEIALKLAAAAEQQQQQ